MLPTTVSIQENKIKFSGYRSSENPNWQGQLNLVAFDEVGIKTKLLTLDKPCYVIRRSSQIGITNDGYLGTISNNNFAQIETLTAVPSISIQQLGDPSFLSCYGVKYAYTTGAMANGIASEDMVIALGKNNILSSFGAAGLLPSRIETAIHRIQQALPYSSYAFNLIHSPSEAAIERCAVDLYLKHNVRIVEASAFLDLTANIVRYRVSGLSVNSQNQIEIKNKIIAKVSRKEVAEKFMQPAPTKLLKQLVEQNLITELQANLSHKIPLADDITVEADSGGHTDNRSLVCLLPSIFTIRDEIQEKYGYSTPVRVGAAGGIGTPQAALAAFMMGAAYIVTGSINQSCIEAGACEHTKKLLAQAEMADVMMAPAADMFEMGVKLQVLKNGTLFAMRSQKLFEFYKKYHAIEEIPPTEREQLETQIFRKSLESVWEETVTYFSQRDPEQISRAKNNPKRKMALIFRWYLGLSSRWSNIGEQGREMDYQIWCGPAMGSCNDWVRGSYLAESKNRKVVDFAHHIMTGAAFLYRLQNLKLQGLNIPATYWNYRPEPF